MKKRIFYSWQSDLPNNTNRAFINTALDKAITEINSDDTFSLIPFLDRDTAGLAGSPDIAASIFEKIDNSSVFVCDISIVNGISIEYRVTPNPNVLIELGYAISKIGWGKIILVMNENYGEVESLPFDLRGRKILTYCISSDTEHKAEERKKVSSILRNGIRDIIVNLNRNETIAENSNTSIKQIKQDSDVAQAATRKLGVIKSISYANQKNEALIKETSKYIEINRYDLAVEFAREIKYAKQKNELLIHIAESSIKNSDFLTAEKAVGGITYAKQRNELGMKLLELMQ